MAYKCEDTSVSEDEYSVGWEVTAVACICFEEALWEEAKVELKEYDAMFDTSLGSDTQPIADSTLDELQSLKT